MKIFHKWIYFLMMFLPFIAFPLSVEADDNVATVEVWGEALIHEGDRPKARECALQEAFSAAITQVMGAFITAESYTRNYVSIERSVLGKTQGYVRTYKIVSELVDGDILRLQVAVTVSKEEIKDDLTALGILLDAMGNPVVLLRGKEDGLGDAQSAHVFNEKLAQKGFQVIEGKRDRGTDVFVDLVGTIQSQTEVGNIGLNGAVVNLRVKAFWKDTDRVILSIQKASNGAGMSADAALKDAYNKAANVLFPEFLEELAKKWGQEITNGRTFTVNIEGVGYGDIKVFLGRLSRVFGVKKVDLQSFENGTALALVRFTGKSSLLADLIHRTRFEGLSTAILAVGKDSIVVKLDHYNTKPF